MKVLAPIQFDVDTSLYRSAASTLKPNGAMAFGAIPATTGFLRCPNGNYWITWRNAANTADARCITFGVDDRLRLGTNDISSGVDIHARTQLKISSGSGATQMMEVDAAAGIKVGMAATQKLGFYGATPIVRPTGWAAPTGTATRTTFDTTTATVIQLAERVKALTDDLTALGIIGP